MIRGAKLTGNLHVLAQSRRSSLRLEHSSIRPTPTWSPSPSCQLGHVRRSFASSSVSRAPEPVASSVASISSSADSALSILDPLLPILHSIPSYLPSTLVGAYPHTISLILLTIAVRASFTLPATLWQRARTARMNNLVVPEWQAWKARLPPKVARQCKREKKSYAEYKEELQKQLRAKLSHLLSQHNCAPLPTILVPLAVHLPLFLLMSALIRQGALPSTPWATEVLAWWSPPADLAAKFASSALPEGLDPESLKRMSAPQGPTLADRDSTMAGPLALGMLALLNVELGAWNRRTIKELAAGPEVPKDENIKASAEVEGREGEPTSAGSISQGTTAEGKEEPLRTRIITNVMRVGAIAFVPIASQAPGALLIYWLSSSTFTLAQNSIFALLDRKRERLAHAPPSADVDELP